MFLPCWGVTRLLTALPKHDGVVKRLYTLAHSTIYAQTYGVSVHASKGILFFLSTQNIAGPLPPPGLLALTPSHTSVAMYMCMRAPLGCHKLGYPGPSGQPRFCPPMSGPLSRTVSPPDDDPRSGAFLSQPASVLPRSDCYPRF